MQFNLKSQQKPQDIHDIQHKYSKTVADHLINAFYLVRSFSKTCRSVYFSQAFIGKNLGLSSNRACEIIKLLEQEGFIIKHYRQSKTCEYEMNPYYLQEEQEFKLNRFYKQFVAFSASFLLSISSNSNASSQLKFEVLKELNKSDSISVSNIEKGIAPPATLLSKKKKRINFVMSDQRLQAIASLNEKFPLSTHGIAKLSAYSAAAIEYASRQSEMALTKYDPFGYIANLCNEFDNKNGYAIDWHGYQLRRDALSIAKDDTQFLDQERLEAMVSAQESQKTYAYAPVDRTLKRERPREFTMPYRFMESEERIEHVTKAAEKLGIEKDIIPPKNSAKFFAHILAFGAKG